MKSAKNIKNSENCQAGDVTTVALPVEQNHRIFEKYLFLLVLNFCGIDFRLYVQPRQDKKSL